MRHALLLSLALSPLLRAADPLPGHSAHGEAFNEGPRQAAVLMEGTGRVSFPIQTSKPVAQRFFNQGVGQLHGFWFYEAERSFRQVAALDKDCAMAYWGMAMANVNNETRAKQFTAKAAALKDKAGDSGRLWIKCLENYYKAGDKRDKKQRELDFIRDLEEIVHAEPDNVEAKAFLVWKTWHAKKDAPISSPQAVDALLDQIFAAAPGHPAHHYRIHLWDDRKPARALASAALCGQAAPAIAHMWHMPGHTYSKLKRFDDAVWQQEASTRVDHAHMRREFVLPDQIHNYAHNEEWLVRNFNELGRASDAAALARSLIAHPRHPKFNHLDKASTSASYGRTRLLETLIQWERWEELRSLAKSPLLEAATQEGHEATRLRSLGLACFHLDDDAGLAQHISALEKLEKTAAEKAAKEKQEKKPDAAPAAKPAAKDAAPAAAPAKTSAPQAAPAKAKPQPAKQETKSAPAKPAPAQSAAKAPAKAAPPAKAADEKKKAETPPAQSALAELRALRAILKRQSDAPALLEAAKDLPKDRAARLWLRLGHQHKAAALLKELPQNLAGQSARAEILMACGRHEEARQTFEQIRKLAFAMDADLPLHRRLTALAHTFGIGADWPLAAPKRADTGRRPPLGSLGPMHWSPPQAPEWEALTLEGQPFHSRELAGKNHILIFYLGSACTHCMEQVNAFAKARAGFEKAGIQITAVTTEPMSLAGRLAGQMSDQKMPPFPVLCDPSLDAFRAFRAYDDFEQEALHAAVLVDKAGRLRWLDVSWEPFTDTRFLLAEARRLLRLKAE